MNAEDTAKSFTIIGIAGLIRTTANTISESSRMDAKFGDAGAEPRHEARVAALADLEVYRKALAIHMGVEA